MNNSDECREITDDEIRAQFGHHLSAQECEQKRLDFYNLARFLLDTVKKELSYTEMTLDELTKAGWEVGFRKIDAEHFVAYAKKDGQTCVGEGDGELGALTALGKSIRSLSKGAAPGCDHL